MEPITAEDGQNINGVEDATIVVPSGVLLTVSGVTNGAIWVQDHGEVHISGVARGPLQVHRGARVDVTGRFEGSLQVNEGVLRVAEGAYFVDWVMGPTGFERHSLDRPAVAITRDTPRHRIVGALGNYGVHL